MLNYFVCFFFNVPATTEIYTYGHTLSLHDALPICRRRALGYPSPDYRASARVIQGFRRAWSARGGDDPRVAEAAGGRMSWRRRRHNCRRSALGRDRSWSVSRSRPSALLRNRRGFGGSASRACWLIPPRARGLSRPCRQIGIAHVVSPVPNVPILF